MTVTGTVCVSRGQASAVTGQRISMVRPTSDVKETVSDKIMLSSLMANNWFLVRKYKVVHFKKVAPLLET